MKNIRKLTAILLAVVMVFAMNVSAFAATTSTATLQVNYYGEALLNPSPVTFTITSGMTAKDVLDQYADELEPTWKTVENLNPNFGSTAYAIDTIYGVGSNPLGADSGVTAQFWSSAYPGYGIEYTETVNGETVYHFIYVGEDWEFTVNGEKPTDSTNGYQLYMDQYTVQAGDVIVVNYTQQTEQWTGTYNWLGGV